MDPLYELDIDTRNRLILDYVEEVLKKAGFESPIDFFIGGILTNIIAKDDQYIVDIPTPYFEKHRDEEKIKKMLKVVEEEIGKAELVIDYTLADFTFTYKLNGDNLKSNIDITGHRFVLAFLRIYLNEDKVREILKYMIKKKETQKNTNKKNADETEII